MVNSSLIFVCPLFTPALSCVLLCPSHAPWSSCPKSTELSRKALPLETWRPTLFLGWIFKLRRKQVFIHWGSQAARRYDISSVIKFRSSGETFFSRRLGMKENFTGPRRCVTLRHRSRGAEAGVTGRAAVTRARLIISPCLGGVRPRARQEIPQGLITTYTGIFLLSPDWQRHAVKSLWSRKNNL